MPTFDQLIAPTFAALHLLGGSGSINEVVTEVIRELRLPSSVIDKLHGKGNRTELDYRLAWARTYLKKSELIDNSERGIWSLTPKGSSQTKIDVPQVVQYFQQLSRGPGSTTDDPQRDEAEPKAAEAAEDASSETATWREDLLEVLMDMPPAAFERLCQRMLRESGFIEVTVTGRSGDGGIDGRGIVRIAGLLSYKVLFQSKRYRGAVGPGVVRDFRGAMTGRAENGLIITTGSFTRDAWNEATRDGAPPIDLIDGELLASKLKELDLGVNTKQVEVVEVNKEWFKNI